MKRMCHKKKFKKTIATAVLSAFVLSEALSPMVVLAGPATASVDETMYLNLDYYGQVSKANVVKGINFNSLKTYTDYGDYTEILNMSTEQKAEVKNGSVTWDAPERGGKFFFQGTLDPETVVAPWTFDVTYKVNGVVMNAEDMAGQSGLIEMDIDAYPNKSASTYMQDNFMLIVAIPIDGNKIYSVDAPGSQTATLGQYSGVIFEALPGKEAHFVVRMGTDSFETVGAIMMMAPGTVSDLDNIKDLKELKDKFRDNTNAMMDDVEALMDNVTDMSAQLELNTQMLKELRSGKDKISTAKDSIFAGNDILISDLQELSAELTPLDESLRTTQWMIYDLNKDMNSMDQDLLDVSAKMRTLSTRLKSLGNSMGGVDNLTAQEINAELQEIMPGLLRIQQGIGKAALVSETLNGDAQKVVGNGGYIDQANELVASASNAAGSQIQQSLTEEARKAYLEGNYDRVAEIQKAGEALQEIQNSAKNLRNSGSEAAHSVSDRLNLINDSIDDITGGMDDIFDSDITEDILSQIKSLSADIEDIADDGAAVSFQTARFLNSTRNLLGDMDTLIGTLNEYYPDVQALVENTDTLVQTLQKSTNDLASTLKITNDTLRSASDNFDRAAEAGLDAGDLAVDNANKMIENTKNLKDSGADLRKSINDELDEQEAEHNFLNMDPEAEKVSFTSEKNQEPTSLSIVARTEEISVDDDSTESLDSEEAEAETTPLQRIANVFVRMWEIIKGLFIRED